VSELQDRLIKLADRGTPRGVDAVFDDARRAASLGVIVGGAEDSHDEVIPFVSEEPTARRRARRPFGSMIAAAGVAAMLLVGMLAVSAIVGSGGAGSPAAAVHRLADAVQHGDPLAAADVLAPSEVASLHNTLSEAERRSRELSLVQDASAPLAGVDFSVSNLSLSTETLGDGVAKVTVDNGTLTASTKKANFSPVMQQVLRDSHDNSRTVDLAKIAASEHVPTFVVAVRENGRWYVSAAYTVL